MYGLISTPCLCMLSSALRLSVEWRHPTVYLRCDTFLIAVAISTSVCIYPVIGQQTAEQLHLLDYAYVSRGKAALAVNVEAVMETVMKRK